MSNPNQRKAELAAQIRDMLNQLPTFEIPRPAWLAYAPGPAPREGERFLLSEPQKQRFQELIRGIRAHSRPMQMSILDLVDDTAGLVGQAPPVAASVEPRCRMCARPARWNPRRSEHSAYCSGAHCSNKDRICQSCSCSFAMGIKGAGVKYCAECRSAGCYRPNTIAPEPIYCAWCKIVSAYPRKRINTQWPYVCDVCIDPIRHVAHQLKVHNVPHERAARLAQNPGCDVCGTNILKRMPRTTGRARPFLVVDHDHRCCPSDRSCGSCFRGLLCMSCNSAAGFLRDSPANATALAAYLERGVKLLAGV